MNESLPPKEVTPKAKRRSFTASYRLRILEETEASPGEVGKILGREGLYNSILGTWRRQRDEGLLVAVAPRKRGPKKRRRARAQQSAIVMQPFGSN